MLGLRTYADQVSLWEAVLPGPPGGGPPDVGGASIQRVDRLLDDEVFLAHNLVKIAGPTERPRIKTNSSAGPAGCRQRPPQPTADFSGASSYVVPLVYS
jgi:hypothetical protein